MAQGAQCHDGQSSFARLKADVGPVEVKPQRGVEAQARIAANDQQQLIEGRDRGGQLGPVAEQSATIDDPADAFGGERLREISRR